MTGPPTPPPTTAAELLDEEKDREPTTAPVPPEDPPQPKQDSYQLVFPTIVDLVSKRDFRELINIAERTEINSENEPGQSQLLVAAPLVLAYLILDDLAPARYALTRLPADLLALPLPQVLLKLLVSSSERNHVKVYSHAEELSGILSEPDFPQEELASVISGMLEAFLDSFRHRTFVLLSKAYVSIPLSLMQMYLGLPGDQLLPTVQKHNWSYDASTQILTPSVVDSNSEVRTASVDKSPSSLDTFRLVANSVAKLEM